MQERTPQYTFIQQIKVLDANAKCSVRPYDNNAHLAKNPVIRGSFLVDWDVSNANACPSLAAIQAVTQAQIDAMEAAEAASAPKPSMDWDNITKKSLRVFGTPTFNGSIAATQLSATRDALVSYVYNATVSISLVAGQSVTATLRYGDNAGMANAVVVDSSVTSNSGVLGLSQTNALKLTGIIPAGKFRQVTFSVNGNGAAAPNALAAGQEVLL